MGNNGVWGLEKHPMELVYGYSVAADLRPGTRYDQMAEALGCEGELVERPAAVAAARSSEPLAADRPALVNVLTDPTVAYPRRSEPGVSLKARKPPGRGRLPQVGLEGQAGVRSSEASGVG